MSSSQQQPQQTGNISQPRAGGVADYFAILGVGDTLVLKSTQKERSVEDEAPPPPSTQPSSPPTTTSASVPMPSPMADQSQSANAEGNAGAPADTTTTTTGTAAIDNTEEECAWVERFYREIVDVTVVVATGEEDGCGKVAASVAAACTPSNHQDSREDATIARSASQTSSVATPAASSDAVASQTSPVTSEATSAVSLIDGGGPREIGRSSGNGDGYAAFTGSGGAATFDKTIASQGGYEIVRRTAAALAPIMTVRTGGVTAEEQKRDADLNAMSGLRAAVLSSSSVQSAAPGLASTSPGKASSRSIEGTAAATNASNALKSKKVLGGIGRKVGDKLRTQLNPILGVSTSQEWLQGAMSSSPRGMGGGSRRSGLGGSGRRRSYYVAFRRRGADELDRPAVADVALRYVRVHRSTILGGNRDDIDHGNEVAAERSFPADRLIDQGSTRLSATAVGAAAFKRGLATGAGIAAQMAASGASRLVSGSNSDEQRGGSRSDAPLAQLARKHFFPDTAEKPPRDARKAPSSAVDNDFREAPTIPLADLLALPSGYDEWSIPDKYKSLTFCTLGDDDASTSNGSKGRSISPSMSGGNSPSTRLRRTVVFAHTPSGVSPSEASGVGVEALLCGNSPSSFSIASSQGRPNSPLSSDGGEVGSRNDALLPLLMPLGSIPTPTEEDDFYEYVPVLAIRLQRVGDEERYREDPAAIDIVVTHLDESGNTKMFGLGDGNDDEEDDDEGDDSGGSMSILVKTGWSVSSSSMFDLQYSRNVNEGVSDAKEFLGTPILLLRHNSPQGFGDAAFATSVQDRFPTKDYKGLPLPEEELPMFCYPTGCRLHRSKFQDAPLAQCYGFVVKNERGDSIHVSCVSFMEPLTKAKADQLDAMSVERSKTSIPHRRFWQRKMKEGNRALEIGGAETDNFLLTAFDDHTTFENKTICLVSRYPFWTAFRRFLSHLHLMSGSSSEIPLERYISHLLLTVPVPKPGGQGIMVPLPALNGPMILSMPPTKDLPLLDLPFQRLFACLDVPSVVTIVLGFLALERKVIIMSTHPSLVLDVCELLRSLLFPFELCAPYVPRLTQPFMSCLDFPGAIFVGIHDDESKEGLAASVRKNMPEDSVIIDLDSGDIDCSSDRYEVLKQCWNIVPSEPRTILVQEIETICRDAGIVPGQEPIHSQLDSAFDASVPTTSALVQDFDGRVHRTKEPLDDRAVRDSFLRFFCSILGGYERYLVVPDADFVISGNEWFDDKGFVSSVASNHAPYLGSLVSTQLFQSFIQRRTEASDIHCVLFDDCLSEFHSSALPYGRLGGDVETLSAADGEDPHVLFSLLVDQCATELLPDMADSSVSDVLSRDGNRSVVLSTDGSSEADVLSSPPLVHISASRSVDGSFLSSGADFITAPSRQNLSEHQRFVYCIDGHPCFPNRLERGLFFPTEPEKLSAVLAQVVAPVLTRSDRELDESNRRKKLAISHRGLHNQRRCLWQLPKLMGSHVLGSWLMCIPPVITQQGLSSEQQARCLLRALGAMRTLRSRQRIIPDEAAYRSLMVACGRASSDRRIELVKLFGLLRSDGIFPSAVTLGQYTRAIAEGFSKRSSGMPDEKLAESAERQVFSDSVEADFASVDAEALLNTLDANLSLLEDSGRRWRHRYSREDKQEIDAEDADVAGTNATKTPLSSRSHKSKNKHKSWIPVACSTSFVPLDSGQKVENLCTDDFEFIALWSRTSACPECAYIPLDEEVMCGWDNTRNESEDPSCEICCPRCGSQIIPLIGHRTLSVDEAVLTSSDSGSGVHEEVTAGADKRNDMLSPNHSLMTSFTEGSGLETSISLSSSKPAEKIFAEYADLPPQIRPFLGKGGAKDAKSNYVAYLSPSSMRLLLEQYVEERGEDVLERETLRKLDSRLYYNLWWYCARFSLPLPLMISRGEGPSPKHLSTFVCWDRSVSERACKAGASALLSILRRPSVSVTGTTDDTNVHKNPGRNIPSAVLASDMPLLSHFNFQSYAQGDWDHEDLSKILVKLVEACDKKDLLPVIECVLQCNDKRRGFIERSTTETSGSEIVTSDVGTSTSISGTNQSSSSETIIALDCYLTLLYLARYQCTSAFHTFFPATLKACKGYHFWCAQGTPCPLFDRYFRDATKRLRTRGGAFTPIQDASDVSIGFRCVFGHLI